MGMKLPNCGPLLLESARRRLRFCNLFPPVSFLCIIFLIGSVVLIFDYKEKVLTWKASNSMQTTKSNLCERQQRSFGTETLPKGIVSRTSNLEMRPLWGSMNSQKRKGNANQAKSLLAVAVGIKQKEVVDRIVKKFPFSDFTVMLFHYDGVVDAWRDLQWSDTALHISAINQTKWWFAKRFLHPDIVTEYDYIFLWDEDLEVENFDPKSYLSIIKREGLEISQPALDVAKSEVHHQITARGRRGDVHSIERHYLEKYRGCSIVILLKIPILSGRTYKFTGGGRCYENSTAPPCTGWVEMMAPVFSRAAWRCAWHMVQNDLIHAWGLDMKLGYCAQGDRSKNIGIVDREYIVHKGVPTLGGIDENKINAEAVGRASDTKTSSSKTMAHLGPSVWKDRLSVRRQSYAELIIFRKRWDKAVAEDQCWTDPYSESTMKIGL